MKILRIPIFTWVIIVTCYITASVILCSDLKSKTQERIKHYEKFIEASGYQNLAKRLLLKINHTNREQLMTAAA